MASKKYQSKAKTTKIVATSRGAIKIRDNYFTLEFSEERSIPEVDGVDLEAERQMLWDDVNGSVDEQIQELVNTYKNKN